MKKKLLLLCLAAMVSAASIAACQKKEEPSVEKTQETSRIVEIPQCGLRYEAPKEWIPYETTNIIPIASTTTEGDIYAHVQYNYVTDKNMEILNTFSEDTDTASLMSPFGEIFVIHKDKLEAESVKNAFSHYDTKEEVTTQGDYRYFMLSDYNGDTSSLTEEERKVYESLKKSIQPLKESISTFEFDEAAVAKTIDKLNRTITFASKTLEGDEIDSTIFGKYDLTLVNFWASYCYPDINETAVMQEVKVRLEKEYPNVNLIQVLIDTPTEKAEKIALQAKTEAVADFTSVMPDKIFANWIVQNLKGLPTTVFVDSNGEVTGEQIQGVQTADFYMNAVKEKLKQHQTKDEKEKKTENPLPSNK